MSYEILPEPREFEKVQSDTDEYLELMYVKFCNRTDPCGVAYREAVSRELDRRRNGRPAIVEVEKSILNDRRSCAYQVGEHKARLFVGCGGVLTLSFTDSSFKETFNAVEMIPGGGYPWAIENRPRWTYLEGGAETVHRYLDRNLPLKRLSDLREEQLNLAAYGSDDVFTYFEYRSPRLHDKENRSYFYCEVQIGARIPCVTVTDAAGNNRNDATIQRCANSEWAKRARIVNRIFDKYSGQGVGLEGLTDEEFATIMDALKGAKKH